MNKHISVFNFLIPAAILIVFGLPFVVFYVIGMVWMNYMRNHE